MSIYAIGSRAIVSFNSDMLEFVADGTMYPAIRVPNGWKVMHPVTKVTIAVPDSIISYVAPENAAPPQASVVPQGFASVGTIAVDMSKYEASALEQFREGQKAGQEYLKNNAQQAFPARTGSEPVEGTPEKKKRKKSIVSAMLEDEMLQEVASPEQIRQKELLEATNVRTQEGRARLAAAPAVPFLKPGQFWLTDLTEGVLPTSKVNHIITTYAEDHFPEPIRADIPEVNIYHAWNADVLESIHMAHTLNVKNLLNGFPGSGKSTSTEQYGAWVRQPYMKLNGKSGIDGSAFIGFLWANSTGTQFAEGLLPVAMRNGYLLTIDEVFKIPAEVQMNFQTVYEENGFLLLDEKPGLLADKLVHPHPDFRLMATDNCLGTGDSFEKFGATQVQDSSTLDRFGLTVLVPYLPLSVEVGVLHQMYPNIKEASLSRLVKTAGLVREAYQKSNVSLTLSMRGLKVMARLMAQGVSELHAFTMTYTSKLADDAEINTVQSFITTAGLSDKPGEAIIPPPEPKVWEDKVPEGLEKLAKEVVRATEMIMTSTPLPWDDAPRFEPPTSNGPF